LDYVFVDGDEFNEEEDESAWPSGCYYCDGTADCLDGVWFNTASPGSAYDTAVPICGKASWVAALGATETLFVGDSDIDYWQTSPQFVDSENIGFGGYTCEDVVGEFDAYQATFGTPATVVLVCGENDLAYGSSVAATFNFFKEIVAKANAAGGTIIYFGTKLEPDTWSLHDEYEAYDAKIRDLVSEFAGSLVMIDVYPSFEALGNPDSLYADDDLHLSDDGGYAYWNQWLATALADDPGCLRWVSDECSRMGIRRRGPRRIRASHPVVGLPTARSRRRPGYPSLSSPS
jgi:lysophospholipase L1-like esterase